MTFSENQVRHLYVVNTASDVTALAGKLKIGDETTDLVENILSTKRTNATDLQRYLKAVKITLTDGLTSAGAPIPGEDYVVRIEYTQFVGKSDEEFYHEFGCARATSASTVGSLLLELAQNLAANTKKQGMVKIAVTGATTGDTTLVDIASYDATTNGDVTAIFVEEIEQPWILGVKEVTPVKFTVNLSTVVKDGEDVIWGAVADATSTYNIAIGDGKLVADMEYFFHGERGDIYRAISWPQMIYTNYRAVATNTYTLYDIHYAYIGENHSVQKSEKTLTIAVNAGVGGLTTVVEGLMTTAFGIQSSEW